MPQEVQVQIFPFQLEWMGGRNTLQQSAFSMRNAYICLEDMKESDVILPLIIEKYGERMAFRTSNELLGKDFDINSITQIHFFPAYPTYAVFEIAYPDGPSRFEVVRAPSDGTLNHLNDFLFKEEFSFPSAPLLPRGENSNSSASTSDAYEAAENSQPVINGVSTPEFQTEEAYEEVALKLVDETIEERVNSESNLEVELPMEPAAKEETVTNEVGKTRSSLSTTSISSDTNVGSEKNKVTTEEIANGEPDIELEEGTENDQTQPIGFSKTSRFAKLCLLKDIIAEEKIDTKHFRDDGRVYMVTRPMEESSKIKLLPIDTVGRGVTTFKKYGLKFNRYFIHIYRRKSHRPLTGVT